MLVVLGMLAAGVAPGQAFQETKGGSVSAPSAAEAQQAPGIAPPGLDLNGTGTSIAPPTAPGLEVRIPGLGKLGVLPKLDFGLELLYGVNGGPAMENPSRTDDGTDDLRIRGSLKHRF